MSKNQKNSEQTVSGVSFVRSKEHITEFLLKKNGLTILYVEVKGSPTVTTNIVYHVGSQHEGRGETGLAHMLEHMLFKPTKTKTTTYKDLEDKGALMNATTWLDRTMYYFTLPKEYLNEMLLVEADRMRNVMLVDKEFQPERTNVLSEYEMYNSRPETALEWNILSTAFQAHGYRHDTIGFRNDIERYTPQKLRNFYNRFYWPGNATLIIVGDCERMPLLKLVKKIFSRIQHKEMTYELSTKETRQEGLRRVTLQRSTPLRVCSIAFKAPRFRDREWTALYLALMYLTEGKTSILYTSLVDAKLATSVSGHLYQTKDPFLAFIEVYASENTPYQAIEDIIFNKLDALRKTGIPSSKLNGLKQLLYSSELYSRDGTFNIATKIGEYVASGDWTRYQAGLAEIKNISVREVKNAVQIYLVRSQATIGTLEKP